MKNLVRSIAAILLIAALMLQSMSKLVVYTEYLVNQDYIASVLCINKTQKNNTCNGKCHLQKELKEDDKRSESPASSTTEKFEVQWISESIEFVCCNQLKLKKEFNHTYSFSIVSSDLKTIFHPPQA